MKRLVILGCSATKSDAPGYIPAIERYTGPLWQTLRATDPKGELASSAFVSARYGFGCSSTPIQNYNDRMTAEMAASMICGGLGTRWPRPPSWKHPDNYGNHAGMEIAGLTRYGREPFDEVAIVAGGLYVDVARAFVEMFQLSEHAYVRPDARVITICDQIGYMRQQLREWLLSAAG